MCVCKYIEKEPKKGVPSISTSSLLGGASLVAHGKESTFQCKRHGFDPWVKKIPQRGEWQPSPVFLPGKSHGQRSLAGCHP